MARSLEPEREIRAILVGGLPRLRGLGESTEFASSLSSSPTLHDFGVVLARYSNASFLSAPNAKWKDWQRFLRSGGIAFVLGVEPSIQRHAANLVGHSLPSLVAQDGQWISWVRGTRFYEALKSHTSARWAAIVAKADERLVSVIGRNAAGDGVAFEAVLGQGVVVFLPRFDGQELRKIVPKLVKVSKRQVARLLATRGVPDWAESIALPMEAKVREEIEAASRRLEAAERAKRVLFYDGKSLSKECAHILDEILKPDGFDVQWKEEEGLHDIEISGGTVDLLVEVRASSGLIDVAVARQLMDHIQLVTPSTAAAKGMIIGNPYRDIRPQERGDSFSPQCMDLAERNHFCLLTTMQLLVLYDQVKRGLLGGRELVENIMSTTGTLRAKIPAWLSGGNKQHPS